MNILSKLAHLTDSMSLLVEQRLQHCHCLLVHREVRHRETRRKERVLGSRAGSAERGMWTEDGLCHPSDPQRPSKKLWQGRRMGKRAVRDMILLKKRERITKFFLVH